MYENLFDLIQPTLFFAGWFGAITSNPNKIVSLIFAANTIVTSPLVYFLASSKFHDITKFSFFVLNLSSLVQGLVLLLSPYLNSGRIQEFFSAMEKVQLTLNCLNIRQPPEPTKTSQIAWIAFFSLLSFSSFTLDVGTGLYFVAFSKLQQTVILLGFYIKLRVLLDIVNRKMDLLNWHLDDLNNRWPLFLPRPPDVTFSELSCVAAWRRTKFVRYNSNVRQLTPHKMHGFNKAHFEICHAFKILKSVYSLDLIALTLTTGVATIFACFATFTSVFPADKITKLSWIVFVLCRITPFIVVLTYSSKIKEKCRKTALLVHDLLDEDGHSDEVDGELEEFSKAMLHRSMNLSVGGFFDFDLKLVSKMASIIAPTALFLIQNANRVRAKNSNHTKV